MFVLTGLFLLLFLYGLDNFSGIFVRTRTFVTGTFVLTGLFLLVFLYGLERLLLAFLYGLERLLLVFLY
jgi:hypothetical protein